MSPPHPFHTPSCLPLTPQPVGGEIKLAAGLNSHLSGHRPIQDILPDSKNELTPSGLAPHFSQSQSASYKIPQLQGALVCLGPFAWLKSALSDHARAGRTLLSSHTAGRCSNHTPGCQQAAMLWQMQLVNSPPSYQGAKSGFLGKKNERSRREQELAQEGDLD